MYNAETDTTTNNSHNKKSNDAKFCMRLYDELSECNTNFRKSKDEVVCDYFNSVFNIKCLGININTNAKTNTWDKKK